MNSVSDNEESGALRRGLDRLYLTSGWLAAAFLGLICLLVLCQVSLNAVDRVSGLLTGSAVGLTIPSYADFTGFFLAASSFLALAHTLRHGEHIRVTLLLSRCSGKPRKFLEIWCLALASGVTIYFAWYCLLLIRESYLYHDLSSGMIAVPIWIPQTAMFLGLLVLAIALIDSLTSTIRNLPEGLEQTDDLFQGAEHGDNGETSCPK